MSADVCPVANLWQIFKKLNFTFLGRGSPFTINTLILNRHSYIECSYKITSKSDNKDFKIVGGGGWIPHFRKKINFALILNHHPDKGVLYNV